MQNAQKRGPKEAVGQEQLLERYKVLYRFLHTTWGRIGLLLKRARHPEHVRKALLVVRGIEYQPAFRDMPSGCLIREGNIKATQRQLQDTRRELEEAVQTEKHLWSEWHRTRSISDDAAKTLKGAVNDFQAALEFLPFFIVLAVVARAIAVEESSGEWTRIDAALKSAIKNKESLADKYDRQEAWRAQTEVMLFARNRRYQKSAPNFAKVMAGIPEYSWLYAVRKCTQLDDGSMVPESLDFRLFELVKGTVKAAKRLDLNRIEKSVRKKLLKEDFDPMVRAHISPNWAYMSQAFAQCRGKGFRRSDLPFEIMARFHDNVERPKSSVEAELARRSQLLS